MSKNYKFIVNPSPLDAKQIRQHQDFDALMGQYQASQKPKGKLRLLYISSAVAASLLLLISFFWLNRDEKGLSYEQAAQAHFASQPFVNPPIKGLSIPNSQAMIEVAIGDTLTFQSGSQIIIPAQAFVDQNGAPIEGQVDIQFREMHDFVDFFISGIPMHYDSNGMRYQLESAGMIEILGYQNGQLVQLAPNKSIAVELVSSLQMPRINTKPPKYNVYQLNVKDRVWEYASVDRIQVLSEENPSDQTFFDQIKSNFQAVLNQIERNSELNMRDLEASYPLPDKPLKPIEQRSGVPTFGLDFYNGIEEVDFYEGTNEKLEKIQRTFNGVIFQLAPNSAPVDLSKVMEVVWQSARIKELNEQEFEITLSSADQNVVLRVIPVIGSSGYRQALNDYNQKMDVYNKAIQDREIFLQDRMDRIRLDKAALIAKEQEQFEQAVQQMVDEGRIDPNQLGVFKVINRFSVHQFGIWNCDRPIAPDANVVPVKLVDKNGKKISGKTTFVANKKLNTVYQFLATNNTPIPFLDDSEFIIWVVAEDNTLSVLKTMGPADKSGKEELRLEVASQSIKSESDIREILYF